MYMTTLTDAIRIAPSHSLEEHWNLQEEEIFKKGVLIQMEKTEKLDKCWYKREFTKRGKK